MLRLYEDTPQRLTQRHFKHLVMSGPIAYILMGGAAYMVRDDDHIWFGLYALTFIAIGCFTVVTSRWMRQYKKFSSEEFRVIVVFGEALFLACIFATAYIIGWITPFFI